MGAEETSAVHREGPRRKTHMQMMCAHIIALLSVRTKGRLMSVGGIPERALRSDRSRLLAAPSPPPLPLLREVDTESDARCSTLNYGRNPSLIKSQLIRALGPGPRPKGLARTLGHKHRLLDRW